MTVVTPIFLLCLTASVGQTEVQQPSETLNLDQAIGTALAHHPRLLKVQYRVKAAKTRVKQARSTYFPQLNVGGIVKQGLSGSASAFGLHGLASSPSPRDMAVSGNVFQDLIDFGRTRHAASARHWELVYFQETALGERARVILGVKNAYYNTLKAYKLKEIAEQTVEERKLTFRQAEVFYRAQIRSKVDVSLARVGRSRAELDLARAQNELKKSLAVLSEAMGLESPMASYLLEEPNIEIEPPESLPSLVIRGLEGRPELGAAEARIRAYEQWVEKARSERYPRLMGAFSGGWTRFAELTLGKLLFGGIGLRLPLFTGGRLKANIAEAEEQLEEVKAVKAELRQNIRLEINTAYHELTKAMQGVEASEEIVQQVKDVLRLARLRYRMEIADFVELFTAETTQIEAKTDHAQTLYDYKIRQSELSYAIGRDGKEVTHSSTIFSNLP